MPGLPPIEWRVHLKSSADEVYAAWTTDRGRELFWAERSEATADGFRLTFINGQTVDVRLLEAVPLRRLVFSYFGGSTVCIDFEPSAGCDLCLREKGVPQSEHINNYAGWVSVLLSFKAAVDFGIDLRGRDPARTWDQRYVDN